MTEIVDHFTARNQPVNPVGLDFGNGAQNHAEPMLCGQFDQPVVIVIDETVRRRLDPSPADPELDGVEAGFPDLFEITLPMLRIGKRGTVILDSEIHRPSSRLLFYGINITGAATKIRCFFMRK